MPSRQCNDAGRNLLEQLQPFRRDAVFPNEKTGGIAARPCQAIDVARRDRIGDGREYAAIAPFAAGDPHCADRGSIAGQGRASQQKRPVHVRYRIVAADFSYSITSSAMLSNAEGTMRPSCFAVIRLMTNWNLVGRTTGISAGLAPLMMRPAVLPPLR